jgi:hypothetical protein
MYQLALHVHEAITYYEHANARLAPEDQSVLRDWVPRSSSYFQQVRFPLQEMASDQAVVCAALASYGGQAVL